MKWLMGFLGECYEAAPAHLNVQMQGCEPLLVHPLEAEADELCSFVGKKANRQWMWLALDVRSRQVIGFLCRRKAAKKARGSCGTSSRRSIASRRRFTRMLMHPTEGSFPRPSTGRSARR